MSVNGLPYYVIELFSPDAEALTKLMQASDLKDLVNEARRIAKLRFPEFPVTSIKCRIREARPEEFSGGNGGAECSLSRTPEVPTYSISSSRESYPGVTFTIEQSPSDLALSSPTSSSPTMSDTLP